MKARALLLILLCTAALTTTALAAEPVAAKIHSVDARTGSVIGRVTATGRGFEFQVKDAAQLRSLKVGQLISADLDGKTVFLSPARPGIAAVPLRILRIEPVSATATPGSAASASASTSGEEISVVFTCPTEARIKKVDWEFKMNVPYTEDPGDGGRVEITVAPSYNSQTTTTGVGRFEQAKSYDQRIWCIYRQGELVAEYRYDIHREVKNCTISQREVRCVLRP
ncbi:MAG: hypothetical protein OEW64_10950 [Gammaproteobacteria bacterium]|nr:hypothetical protein [Gammaproteobacteria bacterium]MDH5304597.1 hypothetical protein [Gammaproteobacteria bacterium]